MNMALQVSLTVSTKVEQHVDTVNKKGLPMAGTTVEPGSLPGSPVLQMARRLYRDQRPLVLFALAMLLLAIPALAALLLDPRTVHGVANWAKPLKFMAAGALFALTMAWIVGLLPQAQRQSRTIRTLAWVVIGTQLFEVGYISLQAALGAPSHYNTADPFHAAMFGLMGLAAVLLVATQPVLAWQLRRQLPPTVLVRAVVAGLWLTFLLSVASGFLLGGLRPPAGGGIPVVGWHLGGSDLRPAHFLAVHAQQLLPLAGVALQQLRPGLGRALLPPLVAAYVLAWAGLVFAGFPRAG
jgi:hypothetical protein